MFIFVAELVFKNTIEKIRTKQESLSLTELIDLILKYSLEF